MRKSQFQETGGVQFVQGATGEPNCWGEGGRRGEHKKSQLWRRVQQGSIRKSQVLEVKGRGGGGA